MPNMTTSSATYPDVRAQSFTSNPQSKFRSFPLVLLWAGRSHFNSADERSFREANDTEHDFGDVLRRDLPFRATLTGFPGKVRSDASGHDVGHGHAILAVIKHSRLAQPIESKL